MKKAIARCLVAACVGLLAVVNVQAQTCIGASTIATNGNFSGNNCSTSANENSAIGTFCGSLTPTAPISVFTWNYTSPAPHSGNITVSSGNTPFDIALGVIRGQCSGSGTCVTNADAHQDTTAESVDLSLAAFGTTGTYYLLVTSLSDGSTGAQCGDFSGTVGTLPVKLQSFSID